ncbi:hypothetical protein DIPPA_24817 [Diplonema papillatum]|nr:hypothetical protein DIPPA_24817 [Diplonema papillatum]
MGPHLSGGGAGGRRAHAGPRGAMRFGLARVAAGLLAAVCVVSGASTGSLGLGGVQLGSGLLTEADCLLLIEQGDVLPCACRSEQPVATNCHPNCCETDRCHTSHADEWSVYEQIVCRSSATQDNYRGDGACMYNGGNPYGVSAVPDGLVTRLSFVLSKQSAHACENLFVAPCLEFQPDDKNAFRLFADDGRLCWQSCPPVPVESCTAASCRYHRGKTHAFVRHWAVPALQTGSVYAL